MEIGEFIKNAIRGKGLSLQEAATMLGISRQTLHNQLNSATPKNDFLQNVKDTLGIDYSKLISEEVKSTVEEITSIHEPTEQYTPIGSTILHVPIEAEAGFIGGAITPAMNYDLRPWSLPGFDEPGFSFSVKGMSMYNTLKEGELIVTGQRKEEFNLIRRDYIYVIVTKENIVTKRVNKKSDGTLVLISDNQDFKPFEVNYDDVTLYRGRRNVSYDLSKKYYKQ